MYSGHRRPLFGAPAIRHAAVLQDRLPSFLLLLLFFLLSFFLSPAFLSFSLVRARALVDFDVRHGWPATRRAPPQRPEGAARVRCSTYGHRHWRAAGQVDVVFDGAPFPALITPALYKKMLYSAAMSTSAKDDARAPARRAGAPGALIIHDVPSCTPSARVPARVRAMP